MMLQEKKIKHEEKISSPFDNSEENVIGKKYAFKKYHHLT